MSLQFHSKNSCFFLINCRIFNHHRIQDLDVTKKSEEHTWLSPAVEERSRKVRFKEEEEEEEEEEEDSSSMEESDDDSEEEDSDDFTSESEEEDRVGIRHGKTQVIRFSHSRLQSQEVHFYCTNLQNTYTEIVC